LKCPITQRRVEVSPGGNGRPFILVAASRLGELRTVLRRLDVKHSADDTASGVVGLVVVRLPGNTDVERIQQALDAVD